MDKLLAEIAAKKAEYDRLRQERPAGTLAAWEHSHDIELTYSSNAIEGNTLSAVETLLVIEKGITIGGKPLKDHLEAIDHFEALAYVRDLARQHTPLGEIDIRNLHSLVVRRSLPETAGQYADTGRFILTDAGQHFFPSPAEIPGLMGDFAAWLKTAKPSPETAFRAHRDFVTIHPFRDGNGRTGRLLMNLLLLRADYPPIAIRPEDRPAYLRALQAAQADGGAAAFDTLMYERLDATLGEYLRALGANAGPG
jgi:Fic family protein